jgi:hypothetical protein
VEAAPAIVQGAQTAGSAANTTSLSLYVRASTAIGSAGAAISNAADKAGTAISNTAAAGVQAARTTVVAIDTLRSGGGALKAATDFVQGATSSTRVPNNPFGWAGRVARIAYDQISK